MGTLHKILKSTFHLKFASLQKANLKYRDPTYNDKRQWISRLLAQFMLETSGIDSAIIISLDESNFRSDSLPSKQWQFNPNIRVKQPPQSKLFYGNKVNKSLNVLFASDVHIDYGDSLNKFKAIGSTVDTIPTVNHLYGQSQTISNSLDIQR